MEGSGISMSYHSQSIKEVIKLHGIDIRKGHDTKTAEELLLKNGKNTLKREKKVSLFKRFLSQLADKMIIILMISAAISAVMAYFTDKNFAEPLVIIAIVILNATIGLIQESKAEKAIEALLKLTTPFTTVLRDGEKNKVSIEDVVVGDVVFIEKGNLVPADARIITSHEMITDESALTGESLGVTKYDCIVDEKAHIGDRHNMVYANTIVSGGYGSAVVVATGMDTYMGSIASLLNESESPQTPLQRRLAKTGSMLGNLALAICTIIFITGILKQIPIGEKFITSVSLAVAAIPEGLPAIVTVMLSIGVQRIAKSRAIVRKLPAVETLGCSNVICSDKTGTLTQNKMTAVEFSVTETIFFVTAFFAVITLTQPNPHFLMRLQDLVFL